MTIVRNWVVVSDGAYLLDLRKAMRGDGVDGGAFTLVLGRAKRFTWHSANAAAAKIYHGKALKVEV